MKDIKVICDRDEIQTFLDSILRTGIMRRGFRETPFLADLAARFASAPRLVFRATDAVTERGNFTSWMNALALRDYESPAVNDLYYLHEICHIATMPYDPRMNFSEWRAKMFRNELEASVVSEAFVYLLCPDLRPLSFSVPIWVDRFLEDLKTTEPAAALVFLLAERDRIQNHAHTDDPQELRIHSYQRQNEEWAKIWSSRYVEIEEHMAQFYRDAARSPNDAGQMHLHWIQEQIARSARPYPFAAEVEAFARYCAGDKTAVIPDELKLKKP